MSGFFGALFGTKKLPPAEDNPVITPKPDPVTGEPTWLLRAKAELGQKEIAGSKDNPRIVEYHKTTTLKADDDETAWCASFVGWCLGGGTRSAAARSYLKYGTPLKSGQPGAVVVFSRGSNPAHGHVGFYLGEDEETVSVLGGNQSNSVCVAQYPKSRVLGYRWPAA